MRIPMIKHPKFKTNVINCMSLLLISAAVLMPLFAQVPWERIVTN